MALGEWQVRCRTCYVRFKDGLPPLATLAALQAEMPSCAPSRWPCGPNWRKSAERKSRAPRATRPIPREQWRRLMMLVHPDKHGGSEAAVRAAQWLNQVRP